MLTLIEQLDGKPNIAVRLQREVQAAHGEALKRVAAAVGEGSMAIAFVHQYLACEGLVARR